MLCLPNPIFCRSPKFKSPKISIAKFGSAKFRPQNSVRKNFVRKMRAILKIFPRNFLAKKCQKTKMFSVSENILFSSQVLEKKFCLLSQNYSTHIKIRKMENFGQKNFGQKNLRKKFWSKKFAKKILV